jgi:hypothetical protein
MRSCRTRVRYMSRLNLNYVEPEFQRGRHPVAQFVQTFVLAVGACVLAFWATYYIGAHF